jgi:hypothetical protein
MQVVKKFLIFYGPWSKPDESIPNPHIQAEACETKKYFTLL